MSHKATELVFLSEDPDAQGTTFLHRLVAGIDPGSTGWRRARSPRVACRGPTASAAWAGEGRRLHGAPAAPLLLPAVRPVRAAAAARPPWWGPISAERVTAGRSRGRPTAGRTGPW
ncbi:hypothetical protein [Streptomyces sp. NPDC054783]